MRLLLVAPEIRDRGEVRNFSGVWSWYLAREMERRGVSLRFDRPLHGAGRRAEHVAAHYRSLDLDGIDHIVALGTRYFEHVERACGQILMQRCRGAVTQVHDSARDGAPVHCTFTLRSDRTGPRNHYVGWAADPKAIRPTQAPGELRILVDHPDYGVGRTDHSERIAAECCAFVASGAWRSRFASVRLRRFVDGAIEDFSDGDPVRPYHRRAVPFDEACREYGQASVFLVTHPESVGLSVLETAMAGALPVAPAGFVPEDRLATVRHLTYDGAIPWGDVLDQIDVAASRARAVENSWTQVAARMLAYLNRFDREHA